jgi:hypothetical protein
MAEDTAGCIGAVLAIAAVGWIPLHFSGKSILYWRETKEIREIYDSKSFLVTCRYRGRRVHQADRLPGQLLLPSLQRYRPMIGP